MKCPYKIYGCNSKCSGQLLRSEYDEHVKNTENMLAAVPSLFLTVQNLQSQLQAQQIELFELKNAKGKSKSDNNNGNRDYHERKKI